MMGCQNNGFILRLPGGNVSSSIALPLALCYNCLDCRGLPGCNPVQANSFSPDKGIHPVIPACVGRATIRGIDVTSSSSSYRKRVYTKFGDKGETSLLYGGRVSKNDPHTEAYGITDEAVSVMGLARSLSENQRIKDILRDAQRELFTIAAELATEPDKYELFQQHFTPVTGDMVENLERTIDSLEEEFQMPTVFVLPGGSPASSAIDMARTVIRTAERRVVALAEAGRLTNELIIHYLNRLGDLLFVLARYQDRELPIERATGERS